MTTVTFEEDIKIDNNRGAITVSDFFEILVENDMVPVLKELDKSEITPKILEAYEKTKKLPESSFINI